MPCQGLQTNYEWISASTIDRRAEVLRYAEQSHPKNDEYYRMCKMPYVILVPAGQPAWCPCQGQ